MGKMMSRWGVRRGGMLWVAVVMSSMPAVASADVGSPLVRVTRAPGRIVMSVADDSVSLRKEVTVDRAVVTITAGTERLVLTTGRGVLSASGSAGSASMDLSGGGNVDRVLFMLRTSRAAGRARDLLAKVSEGPNTFVGQSILLTRAVLETGTGVSPALAHHQEWVAGKAAAMANGASRPVSRASVTLASYSATAQDRTPGDCWDIYAKEAIRIADDYSDCTDGLRWYEAHLWAGCSLIYSVRAEAAMAWFISCNGGVPFNG